MNELTLFSSEAAKRAVKAAEQSKITAFNAMTAAQKASLDSTLPGIVSLQRKHLWPPLWLQLNLQEEQLPQILQLKL
jgi:hypothetical protein